MGKQLKSVSVYRIRDSFAAQGFGALIKETHRSWRSFSNEIDGVSFRLYVAPSRSKTPEWVEFLEPVFDELPIGAAVNTSAILLVSLATPYSATFAFPMGPAGRHAIEDGAIEPQFGLKVSLNLICGPESSNSSWNPIRIGSVDGKTVSENTISTRRQTKKWAAFEAFGMDVQRDLVRAVTGAPIDTGKWGPRVTGADICTLTRPITIGNITTYCGDLEDTWQSRHYQHRFGWIDNLQHITDRNLIRLLQEKLITKLTTGDISSLELVIPDIIDWAQVSGLQLSEDTAGEVFQELELSRYVDALRARGRLISLTIDHLKRHSLSVLRTDGIGDSRYTIQACLSGEISVNNKIYVIDDGKFFRVAQDYLDELNEFVDKLPPWKVSLPSSDGENEEDYNKRATLFLNDALLLDQKLVRIATQTAGVEICDILTQEGCLVHVKRGRASATLSHLFSQGEVSARLLISDTEFRTKAASIVEEAVFTRIMDTNSDCSRTVCDLFQKAIVTSQHEIVYAIIDKWANRTLSSGLPLFSKITLRARVQDLQRMGYGVSIALIDVAEQT